MRMALMGVAAGAACLQMQAVLPSLALIAGAASVWLALLLPWCLAGGTWRVPPLWRTAGAGAFGFALGFLWAAWFAHQALAPQLALADEGQDVKIVGTVDSLPYRFSQGVRFNFAVERGQGVPPRIALSWYAGYREQVSEVPDVQPGERWQLTVRLQRPHGNAVSSTSSLMVPFGARTSCSFSWLSSLARRPKATEK